MPRLHFKERAQSHAQGNVGMLASRLKGCGCGAGDAPIHHFLYNYFGPLLDEMIGGASRGTLLLTETQKADLCASVPFQLGKAGTRTSFLCILKRTATHRNATILFIRYANSY